MSDDTGRIAMVETKTTDTSPGATGVDVPRWRYQLSNHLQSASMELDEAGGVLSYEEYHPYGSTAFHTAKAGAEVSAKRYRYTGKEKDEETGLYYHGARYYAPWLGRWTAADPAGLVDGLNLYRYSRDNPINFSDPSGTQSHDDDEGGFFSGFINKAKETAVGIGRGIKETGEAAGDFAYGVINDDDAATIRGGEKLIGALEGFTIEGQIEGVAAAAEGTGFHAAGTIDKLIEGDTDAAGEHFASFTGNAGTLVLTFAGVKGGKGGGGAARTGASKATPKTTGSVPKAQATPGSAPKASPKPKPADPAPAAPKEPAPAAKSPAATPESAAAATPKPKPFETVPAKSKVFEQPGPKGKKAAFQKVPDPVQTLDELGTPGPRRKTTSLREVLQDITTKEAKQVDAGGTSAFTPAQVNAVLFGGRIDLFPAFRGFQIDKGVRGIVKENPVLNARLKGTINKGVDFTDTATGEIFELTTAGEIAKKQNKYPGVQIIRVDF